MLFFLQINYIEKKFHTNLKYHSLHIFIDVLKKKIQSKKTQFFYIEKDISFLLHILIVQFKI